MSITWSLFLAKVLQKSNNPVLLAKLWICKTIFWCEITLGKGQNEECFMEIAVSRKPIKCLFSNGVREKNLESHCSQNHWQKLPSHQKHSQNVPCSRQQPFTSDRRSLLCRLDKTKFRFRFGLQSKWPGKKTRNSIEPWFWKRGIWTRN